MDDVFEENQVSDEASSELIKKAIEISLRYLTLREYSQVELKKKILQKQHFSPDILDQVFAQLREKNYLSDERYIRQKSKLLKLKGYSTHYIQSYLEREEITINKKDIEALELPSESECLQMLIEKKLKGRQLDSLAYNKKNSIIRYLGSKGYSYSEIKEAFKSF